MDSRIHNLDMARTLAIFLVVAAHLFYEYPSVFRNNEQLSYTLGNIGVEIFFCLSGFLIGIQIIEKVNGTLSLVKFLLKRMIRIFPNYLLFLILHFIYFNVPMENAQRYFALVQNFNCPHPRFFPQAWSLTIEVWSYLLAPILVMLFSFRKPKHKWSVLLAFLALIFVGVTIREALLAYDSGWWRGNNLILRSIYLYRMDALGIGLVMAWLFSNYKLVIFSLPSHHKAFMVCFSFVLLFVAIITRHDHLSLSLLTMHLSICPYLILFTQIKLNSTSASIVSWIANISYTIYLSHFLIQDFAYSIVHSFEFYFAISFYLFLLISISSCWYHFIEHRITNMGYAFVRKWIN